MTTPFIPGLDLARQFHAEVVGPLLDQSFPGITYSAALIGGGSDVLGFDSARSTDHNWGPRLQVFLGTGDADRAGDDHRAAGQPAPGHIPRLADRVS